MMPQEGLNKLPKRTFLGNIKKPTKKWLKVLLSIKTKEFAFKIFEGGKEIWVSKSYNFKKFRR